MNTKLGMLGIQKEVVYFGIVVYFCILATGNFVCMENKEYKISFEAATNCPIQFVLAINDTLNVISGKWKLPIIATMSFGKQRFTEIQRNIPRITPRMLSKELKELELNGIVKRTVYDSIPVVIEYELTDSAKQLSEVMNSMIHWGINHRKGMFEEQAGKIAV